MKTRTRCLDWAATVGVSSVLMLGAVGPATAQTRVHPLDNGNVAVGMEGCSVIFDRRGDIVTQGLSCSDREVRDARSAFQELGGLDGGRLFSQNSDNRGLAGGVTLYRDFDYRGDSESISGDVRDMRTTRIGNDTVSSIRIPDGCRVMAYSDVDFQGLSAELDGDVANFGRTVLGNDQVSSIRVDCGGLGGRSSSFGNGVTLYEDFDFGGASETIEGNVPRLDQTTLGNDQASSIRVPIGCRVALYADFDYGGRVVELDRDEPNLGRTEIGNDQLSSIRVDCR